MSNQELIEYLTDNSGEYNKRINRKYLETHDLNILHILYNVYDDLSEETPVYEIYYRLKNNLKKRPVCIICGKPVKYTSGHYAKFCSKECQYSDLGKKITKEIKIKSNLEKYGVEHTSQLKEVTDKRTKSRADHVNEIQQHVRESLYKKYGAYDVMHIPHILQKIKNTNLKKFGVEFPLQQLKKENSEIYQKISQTCINKFGVDSPLKNKEVREKIKQTNIQKYGVDNLFKSNIIKEKIKQTNIQKYGVDNLFKNDIIKEKIKQTNIQKYGVDYLFKSNIIKEKIKQTNIQKYGVDNPLKNKEIREKIKQTNIQKYGVDNPLKNKEIWKKSQDNRQISSKSKLENNFLNYLKLKYESDDIITQYKSKEYPYYCDFYIKSINLYIEIQGHWTHNDHPFDINNLNDQLIMNKWRTKSLSDKYYKNALNTWTIKDVEKRNTAIQNNLNYLEIFGKTDLNKYIDIFENYIKNMENNNT